MNMLHDFLVLSSTWTGSNKNHTYSFPFYSWRSTFSSFTLCNKSKG